MTPTVMVARIVLVNPSNMVSSGTTTHISGVNFVSQEGSGGSSSANGTSEQISTSAVDTENPINQE